MADTALQITLNDSIHAFQEAEWDGLACPETRDGGRAFDPFMTFRFLAALEDSGSTGGESGWYPQFLALREAGHLQALAPLWLKTHSQGEYIFDHAWADAYERAGGDYYPKMQVAVPFTPVTGRRLLVAADQPERKRALLLETMRRVMEENQLSSLHLTFCREEEVEAGLKAGFLHRVTQQFHWYNNSYTHFDDFLAALSSRKRKAIRKERAAAQASGLELRALRGDEIQPQHWQAFWTFYQDTGARKWGQPYLTREAFDALHATMRDDILLVLAFDGERAVAGALNFIGRDCLYGRYWGAIIDMPFLHFELCYYQAIDFAIAQGFSRVEAGAQGSHKLARGYLPAPVHSLHLLREPGFARAVADYLAHERAAVDEEINALRALGPFKRSDEAL